MITLQFFCYTQHFSREWNGKLLHTIPVEENTLMRLAFWIYANRILAFNWSMRNGIKCTKQSLSVGMGNRHVKLQITRKRFPTFTFWYLCFTVNLHCTRAAQTDIKCGWTFWPQSVAHIQLEKPWPHKKIHLFYLNIRGFVAKIINFNANFFLFTRITIQQMKRIHMIFCCNWSTL